MNNKSSINILLADDDLDDCIFFQDALEELKQSKTLNIVHDGEQLMHNLKEAKNEMPKVLFLDLNMSRKNGFECLEEIKRDKKFKKIPVIIFSTSYDEIIADLLYKNGAHYYICKPAAFPNLKKIIGESLALILKDKISQPPKVEFLLSNLKTMFQ